jgi:hypothetical protein
MEASVSTVDTRRYVSDLSNSEKVLMALVRAAEIFKRTHTTIFRNYGLSFPQYNVLEGKKNHSIETLLKGFSRKDKAELVAKIKQLLRNNMRLS